MKRIVFLLMFISLCFTGCVNDEPEKIAQSSPAESRSAPVQTAETTVLTEAAKPLVQFGENGWFKTEGFDAAQMEEIKNFAWTRLPPEFDVKGQQKITAVGDFLWILDNAAPKRLIQVDMRDGTIAHIFAFAEGTQDASFVGDTILAATKDWLFVYDKNLTKLSEKPIPHSMDEQPHNLTILNERYLLVQDNDFHTFLLDVDTQSVVQIAEQLDDRYSISYRRIHPLNDDYFMLEGTVYITGIPLNSGANRDKDGMHFVHGYVLFDFNGERLDYIQSPDLLQANAMFSLPEGIVYQVENLDLYSEHRNVICAHYGAFKEGSLYNIVDNVRFNLSRKGSPSVIGAFRDDAHYYALFSTGTEDSVFYFMRY